MTPPDPSAAAAGEPLPAKTGLRRRILARRDGLAPEERLALSEAIFERLVALDCVEGSSTILAYRSFGSEPVTEPFLRAVLLRGKALVLPRVDPGARALCLHAVRDPTTQLRPGVWGILEPDPALCPAVGPGAVDLVLVPGIAFDRTGARLGYGGGYYDRLIASLPSGPWLVAAAFEVQMVEAIPMGPHDRRVHAVATERRIYP